jgi:hypothetical protein
MECNLEMKERHKIITEELKELGDPISFNEEEKVNRLRTEKSYIEQELGNEQELEIEDLSTRLPQATSTPNVLRRPGEKRTYTKGKTVFIPFESEEEEDDDPDRIAEKEIQKCIDNEGRLNIDKLLQEERKKKEKQRKRTKKK